ncbi:MAG: DUF6443 domain-containing protein [Chitinophagaceae bacterium]
MNKFKYITFFVAGVWLSIQSFSQLPANLPYYREDVSLNYIRQWTPVAPISDAGVLTSSTELQRAQMTTQFLDGLGRPLQTVIKEGSLATGSPAGAKDVVSMVLYDHFGRQALKMLPYASSKSDGSFVGDPFTAQNSFMNSIFGTTQGEDNYYSQNNFEASPLSRVEEVFAPGKSWAGSASLPNEADRKSVKLKYWTNTAIDQVRKWRVTGNAGDWGSYISPGPYPANELYKNLTVDEHGKQVVEFKDKDGKVIMKKVQLTATADDGSGRDHTGWLSTYYIYDDLDRLRCVIQPEGVKRLAENSWDLSYSGGILLSEQSFRYEYDAKGRMTMKKVPGAAPVYLIYDQRDRLVFVQDGNLRSTNQWIVSLYDALNRPILTGKITYSGSLANLQSSVNLQTTSSGNSTPGLPLDKILSHNNASGTEQALRSIEMINGFETTAGGAFMAEITTGVGGVDGETTIVSGSEVNLNPIPSGVEVYVLTKTFFDDYDWLGQENAPFTASRDNAHDTYFEATTPTYPYPQPNTQSTNVTGLVTGTKVRVLNTDQFLYAVSYYDEKKRLIQSKATNITGATDVNTTQYSWGGLPLVMVQRQSKAGNAAQTTEVITKLHYDDLGRVINTQKRQRNTMVDNNALSAYKTIASHVYDELGQLKKKTLAPDYNAGAGLENLNHDYNIRGWALGTNREFAKNDNQTQHYFGYELGYDKTAIDLADNTSISGFNKSFFNGNISGVIWKSTSDNVRRKYDFDYDAANRLLKADYVEYSIGNWNNTTDFKVLMGNGTDPFSAYDYNGNIKQMQQWGRIVGSSTQIDKLSYTYAEDGKSNRLIKVQDEIAADYKLGDFKDGDSGSGSDYTYDENGNLTSDLNKAISSITYNHLNLPSVITVTGKGTISYTYDALGKKIKKETVDNTGSSPKITTTLYADGIVYENDALQFIGHEEGRIRLKNPDNSFQYDYMLKDHLGNVRMVLTEEQKTDMYPAATLEEATIASEEVHYGNLANTQQPHPAWFSDPLYPESVKAARLKNESGSQKIGPDMLLKVMAGDKYNIRVASGWSSGSTPQNSSGNVLSSLLQHLSNGVAGLSGGKAATASLTGGAGDLTSPLNTFLGTQTNTGNAPKAYVNWILLDEQFQVVSGGSDFRQVGASGTTTIHTIDNIPVTKSGYLYIYTSNESTNIDVFFDNLQVTHVRGRLLEESHYYPFGLTMAGISSKALAFGNPGNKYKYNGYEESDDFELGLNESFYRLHDPQIGRFLQIDPKPMIDLSPYAAMGNNPVLKYDPLGDIFKVGNSEGTNADVFSIVDSRYRDLINIKDGTVTVDYEAAKSNFTNKKGKFNEKAYNKFIAGAKSDVGLSLISDMAADTKTYFYDAGWNAPVQLKEGEDGEWKLSAIDYSKDKGSTVMSADQPSPGQNLSTTIRGDEPVWRDNKIFTKPVEGYDGYVVMPPGIPYLKKSKENGVVDFTGNRPSLIFHELKENYLRTNGNGMSYSEAHQKAITAEGTKFGSISPGSALMFRYGN